MIFGILVNMENTIAINSYSTPWPFSLKNDALPLNSLFWSPPTAVHRFDATVGVRKFFNFIFQFDLDFEYFNKSTRLAPQGRILLFKKGESKSE